MAFNKVFLFAIFSACVVITLAEPIPVSAIKNENDPALEPEHKPNPVPENEPARNKKFAVFSSYAYHYPGYYNYPAVPSYSYSYARPLPYAYYPSLPSYSYVF